MSKQRHVEISIETTNNLSYIQLRGDCDDVANLKFEIQQVLSYARSVESTKYKAKLFYDKVKWQWLDSDNKYINDVPATILNRLTATIEM